MLSPEKRQLGETASEKKHLIIRPSQMPYRDQATSSNQSETMPVVRDVSNRQCVWCVCVCRYPKMQSRAAQHIALAITVAVHLLQGHGTATTLALTDRQRKHGNQKFSANTPLPLPPPWRRRDQARPSRAGRHVSDWPRWKPATPLLQFLGRRCSWPPPETE